MTVLHITISKTTQLPGNQV